MAEAEASTVVVKSVGAIAGLDAAAWDACAGRYQPVREPRVSWGARGQRRGRRRGRLGALSSGGRGRGRRFRGRGADVSQGPLVRRVHLRPRLGRRLRARRRALLPQAADRGPVHAGHGAAADGGTRRRPRGDRARAVGGRRRGRAPARGVLAARQLPRRGAVAAPGRGRAAAAHRRAVPLATTAATPTSRDFSPISARENARPSARSGARRWRRALPSRR